MLSLAARSALLLSLAGLGEVPATAGIVGGAVTGGNALAGKGAFVQLDPSAGPFTVENNNFNTFDLYAFDEKQHFTLTQDLTTNLGQKTIAAGTTISSYLVFFDPAGVQSAGGKTLAGNVTFDEPVIAAFTTDAGLRASDFLGASNVTYANLVGSGLENGEDFLTLGSPTADSVVINKLKASNPGDYFRVITLSSPLPPVPEPATWAMMMVGAALAGGAVARRKRAIAG
jgi:hypothetical protein